MSGPGCVVFASFQNLEIVRDLLGEATVSELNGRAKTGLEALGETFVLGADFVTVCPGDYDQVLGRLQSLAWLVHAFVGVTEAWRLEHGKNPNKAVSIEPTRLLELACGMRFGIEILSGAPIENLDKAAESARAQKADKRAVTRFGFPPLSPGKLRTLTQIADARCPACDAGELETLDTDASGETETRTERCKKCQATFTRTRAFMIAGRDVGSCRPYISDEDVPLMSLDDDH